MSLTVRFLFRFSLPAGGDTVISLRVGGALALIRTRWSSFSSSRSVSSVVVVVVVAFVVVAIRVVVVIVFFVVFVVCRPLLDQLLNN